MGSRRDGRGPVGHATTTVPVWDADAALANTGPLADRGELADLAAVGAAVVRLAEPAPPALAQALAQSPAVIVVVANPAVVGPVGDVVVSTGPVDLGLGPPWVGGGLEGAERVAAAAAGHPAAALVLVQLLRMGPHLGADDALAAESLAYGLLQSGPDHRRWLAGRPAAIDVGVGAAGGRDAVRVERSGGVLALTLDRPEVRNAYGLAVRDGLVAGLQVAVGDPSIDRVDLRGAGPSFCSGGDLREFGLVADAVAAHQARTTTGAGALLAALSPRVEAEVQGHVVGAGLELAAFAGHVRARPDTRFRLPELAMGLVPGAGGTVSVARRIGRERAAWLAITGDELDATTALAWGLVDEVTDG